MFTSKRLRIAVWGVASALFTLVSVAHAGLTDTRADFGQPAPAAAAERTITIMPSTRSVTVENGETVRFVVKGRAFAWHFDTYNRDTNFALSRIAPSDVDVADVHVYLTPDSTYRGF